MEDSCPATPLVLTGRDSKSPLQIALSSPESEGMKSPSPGSPDSRCVICLGRLQNKSFTDSCLHQFCFQCLLQWSKIKAECPLCKQPFKSIIHNVRSNLDYDQYHVEHGEPRYVLSDLMHSYNFDLIPVDRRFRYRSTMTREYFRELAESFLVHTRRLPEDSYQINPLVPVDPTPAPGVRHSNRLHMAQQRTRQRGTSDFRRNIYAQDLWVQNLTDISGRYRECTPQFYRENPAQIHRIIPWLNREVNVLLSDCESHAAYVLSRIISLLTQHPIRSREFKEQVQSYFGDRTDHFIHELFTFARSVYDIAGFDQNAVYGTNPNYATEVQEISSSSDGGSDSDIEVLETVKNEERKPRKSRQGLKKLLLKRIVDEELKLEEPVAGPSGVNSSRRTDSIEICESDPDEIKVLHYVKPKPEVVTLSSGEEAPAYSDPETPDVDYTEVIRLSNKTKRCPSYEDDRKKTKTRSGKGKCKSNGFGLKGKQKRKYIKSRRHRSSSTSSISSSSSSTSTDSSTISYSSYESKKLKSDSSLSSRSSHKSCSKSKRKKSKVSKKKLKKKVPHKTSYKKHKSGSDTEKKKKKRVKSCVIVPSWSCDSSPSSLKRSSTKSSDDSRRLKSYWSIPAKRQNSKGRHRSSSSDEEKSRKRARDIRSSSERAAISSNSDENRGSNSSDSKVRTSADTLSPGSGNLPSTSASLSGTSSSSIPFHLNPGSQSSENSEYVSS